MINVFKSHLENVVDVKWKKKILSVWGKDRKSQAQLQETKAQFIVECRTSMTVHLMERVTSLEEVTELCIHCHTTYLRGENYYGYLKMRKSRHK